MKITKRDFAFFALGFFTLFMIEVIANLETHKNAFIQGFKDGYNSTEKTDTNN